MAEATAAMTSSTSSFRSKLEARVEATNSLLCIGLDPHESELNLRGDDDDSAASAYRKCDAAYTFCHNLIDATAPYACCYKPNAAFFEALGEGGLETLRRVCLYIRSKDSVDDDINDDAADGNAAPRRKNGGIPILLDVKRGDIGSTASAYAAACYEYLGADAVTLSPLMGWDSVSPFVTGTFSCWSHNN
jgi:orotidine-5'-phosphate decarboxylase